MVVVVDLINPLTSYLPHWVAVGCGIQQDTYKRARRCSSSRLHLSTYNKPEHSALAQPASSPSFSACSSS